MDNEFMYYTDDEIYYCCYQFLNPRLDYGFYFDAEIVFNVPISEFLKWF